MNADGTALLPPDGSAFAKLEGRIYMADEEDLHSETFVHYMRRPILILGRSTGLPGSNGRAHRRDVEEELGVGPSNKLSRRHARIEFNQRRRAYQIECLGKNGITVNQEGHTVVMTPRAPPCELKTRALIQLGDCLLVFLLPTDLKRIKKLKRQRNPPVFREFLKAELASLRAGLMKLGYGRWREIATQAGGRLGERSDDDMIYMARKLVAKCWYHAKPGVERKTLYEILLEDLPYGLTTQEKERKVQEELDDAERSAVPSEKRKHVRWARKIRLLRRLYDVYHDVSSLKRLKNGELRITTQKPSKAWSRQDDVDLIIGQYRYGYGSTEEMRSDPHLCFHERYGPQVSTSHVPSRAPKKDEDEHYAPERSPAENGMKDMDGRHSDNEEDDDDSDAENDDDDDDLLGFRKGSSAPEGEGQNGPHNLDKTNELKVEDEKNALGEALSSRKDAEEKSRETENKGEGPKEENVAYKMSGQETDPERAKSKDPEIHKIEPKIENLCIVKKQGMKDEEKTEREMKFPTKTEELDYDLPPLPPTDAMVRRLKSLINACAKEYDRGMRERSKKRNQEERARRRKEAKGQARKGRRKSGPPEETPEPPFSKNDALDFEALLLDFGIERRDGQLYWDRFLAKAPKSLHRHPKDLLKGAYHEIQSTAQYMMQKSSIIQSDEELREIQDELRSNGSAFYFITPERAQLLLEHLDFFRVLRDKVLPNKYLKWLIAGLEKGEDLPDWWDTKIHDKGILWGIHQYGVSCWKTIAMDSRLFDDTVDPDDYKNFPKSPVLLKRAKALVDYFNRRVGDSKVMEEVKFEQAQQKLRDKARNGNGNVAKGPRGVVCVDSDRGAKTDKIASAHHTHHDDSAKSIRREPSLLEENRRTLLNISDDNGFPIVPSSLGDGLWILSFGRINSESPHFHTERLLFPVGFVSVRQVGDQYFLNEVIEDAKKEYPLFRVSLIKDFDSDYCTYNSVHVITVRDNPTVSWLKAANETQGLGVDDGSSVRLVSGCERFGFYEPTICYYLQQLPGVRNCSRYMFRDFSLEGGGREMEPSVGLLDALRHSLRNICTLPSDNHSGKKSSQAVGDEDRHLYPGDMGVPEEWVAQYAGVERRRTSSSYWDDWDEETGG